MTTSARTAPWDTHVKMLRGHLGKCRGYIATVWGIGYKFDPDAAR